MKEPLRIVEYANTRDLRKMAEEIERLYNGLRYDVAVAARAAGVLAGAGGSIQTGASGYGASGVGGSSSGSSPGGGGKGGGGGGSGGGTANTGGFAEAFPAEVGIVPGTWVHVRNGTAAYLADAGDIDRYVTGVCVGVNYGNRLQITNFGRADVRCLAFGNTAGDGSLWLSSVPGWATDVEPASGSGLLSQKIAVKASTQTTGGKCAALIQIINWNLQ